MLNKVALILLMILAPLSFAQDQSKCIESLNQLVKDNPVHKEALREFLKLQAGLTMHKLAYAAFRKNISKTQFTLENEIFKMLKTMEDKRKTDPKFEKVYQLYNHPKNKLSRTALASVLPYIQDILNDQIHESDPFKRKNLILGQSDIKMLAILAEKEKKYSSGNYAQVLLADRSSDNSILNFVKIINSSVRNTNDSVENIRATMLRRIGILNKKIIELFEDLPLGEECKALILSCKNQDESPDNPKVINQDFLGLVVDAVKQLDVEDKHKYLRYGDVWLYTKGKIGTRKSRSKGSSRPIALIQIDTKDKKTDKEVVLEYLVKHVLGHLPNFFTKKDLLEDPELTYALARAIDEGALGNKDPKKRVFFYKGKPFSIPEMWNTSYSSRFGMDMSQYGRKANKWLFRTFSMDDEKVNVPSNIPEKLHEEFLNVRNEQKQKFNHTMTFVFKDELYDIKTGQKLPKSKDSIFAYPYLGNDVSEKKYPELDERTLKMIAQEVKDKNRSYILGDETFHISGAKVDREKEYDRAKSSFVATNTNISGEGSINFPSKAQMMTFVEQNPSVAPVVLKGLADRNRAVSSDDDLFDLYSLSPVTKDGAIKIVINNRKKYGVQRRPADFSSFDSEYLKANAKSILNNRATFVVDNKEYHTDSGRVITPVNPASSILKGYVDHDRLNDQLIQTNAGSDLHVVTTFHKDFGLPNKCSSYTVIDKKESKLLVLDKNKNILFESEVLLGLSASDKRSKYLDYKTGETNNTTGAGIYSQQLTDIQGSHLNKDDFSEKPVFLTYTTKDGAESQAPIAISGVSKYRADRNPLFNNGNLADNKTTNGSIVLPNEKMQQYARHKEQGCPLYILPETNDVKFKIVENALALAPVKRKSALASDFNLTPLSDIKAKNIRVTIKDERYVGHVTNKFVQTLQDNKAQLMRELQLTNAEYNELVKLAFGIMGTESGFGSERMYGIKEKRFLGMQVGQYLVDTMKGNNIIIPFVGRVPQTILGVDTKNSRGMTQVKDVESYLQENHPNIKPKTLNRPEHAAIATMYVLASKLQSLKNLEHNHSSIDESNRMDYLYYLYMGSANQVKQGSATPTLNAKAKEVIGYAQSISVLTAI